MKSWLNKIEHLVDKIIPISLIVLLFLIIGEFFFEEEINPYHTVIKIIDWIIIFIFVVDLTFKWLRIKRIPEFLKKYWLEIIAIFPFFLVFRTLEGLSEIVVTIRDLWEPTQKVVHIGTEISKEIVEVEKGAAGIIKEAEIAGEVSRTEKFVRFLRPTARSTRFLKLTNKKTKKEFKRDIKFIEKEGETISVEGESLIKRIYKRLVKAFVFFEKPSKK